MRHSAGRPRLRIDCCPARKVSFLDGNLVGWGEITGRDTDLFPLQDVHFIELRPVRDAVDLVAELAHFLRDGFAVADGVRSVGCLDGQDIAPLQHVVDLAHGPVRDLDHGNTVHGVHGGPVQAPDHLPNLFGNGETCRIVGRTIDAIAGCELFRRFRLLSGRNIEHTTGVHRSKIVLNDQGHEKSSRKAASCNSYRTIQLNFNIMQLYVAFLFCCLNMIFNCRSVSSGTRTGML